ncbi:hypothetical protein WN944_011824 [Citrus x changshan-huyou]|uniref:Uncharacterized protein n=1 Tax=Citrus x changshan-huyou TaxID=2935761 RepID=A0AAP0N0F0_9ROSI
MGYGSGLVIGLSIGYMVFVTGRPLWFVKMFEKKQSKKSVRTRPIRRGRGRRN